MSCGAKSCSCSRDIYALADPRVKRTSRWLARTLAAVRLALLRRRQRNALLELDDQLLDDIGVTRDQARAEGRKALWQ
jgi:uncharacterized protein YjiS (DUF1127 family)